MSHPGHGVFICQWGYTHGQCRCPEQKFVNVACDDPSHHPKNAYQPRHAKETR